MDFNLAEINYAFGRNYSWMSDPSKINDGDCYIWAYVAHHLIDNSILCSVISLLGSHAFIKIDNRYYDSESLKGENDWRDLKYFKRNPAGYLARCQEQSKDQFEKYWDTSKDLYRAWRFIYNDVMRWANV